MAGSAECARARAKPSTANVEAATMADDRDVQRSMLEVGCDPVPLWTTHRCFTERGRLVSRHDF